MRKLYFDGIFDAPIDQIWPKLEDVNNYPKYIKFCHKAELNGPFEAGSTWYDWSSVAIVPLKITHEIITVKVNREIVYKIKLSQKGELWQKLKLEEENGKTRFTLEVTIDFKSRLLDSFLGPLIYSRNQVMLEETVKNIKRAIQNEIN